MKIIIVCSLPGDFDVKQPCGRADFAAMQGAYRQAKRRSCTPGPGASAKYTYYCSPLPAARQTLSQEFGDVAVDDQYSCYLDEPLLPLPEGLKDAAPFDRWLKEAQNAFRKSKAFSEEYAQTETFLNELEHCGKDCVLLSHPERIRLFLSLLRRRGYLIEKPRLFGFQSLDRIRASKKSLHCGGCQHNCLLSEAKCPMGQDKERMQKNKHR